MLMGFPVQAWCGIVFQIPVPQPIHTYLGGMCKGIVRVPVATKQEVMCRHLESCFPRPPGVAPATCTITPG